MTSRIDYRPEAPAITLDPELFGVKLSFRWNAELKRVIVIIEDKDKNVMAAFPQEFLVFKEHCETFINAVLELEEKP